MLRINFLKMADESRKRARLSLEQKLWIIHHKTENQRITNAKVALDFSVKFNREAESSKENKQLFLSSVEKLPKE